MKLKQATQLAMIGVIFQIIPSINWILLRFEVLDYEDLDSFRDSVVIIELVGLIFLLLFFVTLFKKTRN